MSLTSKKKNLIYGRWKTKKRKIQFPIAKIPDMVGCNIGWGGGLLRLVVCNGDLSACVVFYAACCMSG